MPMVDSYLSPEFASSDPRAPPPKIKPQSRVVGSVLLKFAKRNHFGSNFGQFLEKAYVSDTSTGSAGNAADGANPKDGERDASEHPDSDVVRGSSSQPGRIKVRGPDHGSVKLSSPDGGIDADTDGRGSKMGGTPSLSDNDSTVASSAPPPSEEKSADQGTGRLSSREDRGDADSQVGSTKERTPSHPSHGETASLVYEGAVATLAAMFGPPWSEEALGKVLIHNEYNLTNSIETILSHGDAPPDELVRRLERNDGDVRAADATDPILEESVDTAHRDVPKEVVDRPGDDVSLLSFESGPALSKKGRYERYSQMSSLLPAICDEEQADNEEELVPDRGNLGGCGAPSGRCDEMAAASIGSVDASSPAMEDDLEKLMSVAGIGVQKVAVTGLDGASTILQSDSCASVEDGDVPDAATASIGSYHLAPDERTEWEGESIAERLGVYPGIPRLSSLEERETPPLDPSVGADNGYERDTDGGTIGALETKLLELAEKLGGGGETQSFPRSQSRAEPPRTMPHTDGTSENGGHSTARGRPRAEPPRSVPRTDETSERGGRGTARGRSRAEPPRSVPPADEASERGGHSSARDEERSGSNEQDSDAEALRAENAALKRQVRELNDKLGALSAALERLVTRQEGIVGAVLKQRREMDHLLSEASSARHSFV